MSSSKDRDHKGMTLLETEPGRFPAGKLDLQSRDLHLKTCALIFAF